MVNITKLDCGATLVTEKTDFVQSAALGIWVRNGSANETPEVSGVSHFIEHMMFKGTSTRTAKEIAQAVERIGGMFNAFTGKEATCYYIKTLSSHIYQGAEILIDMLTRSNFAQEELDKERQVILEEIKMVKDTPDDDVFEMIGELVSSGNPLGNSILGTPESLAGINHDEIVKYYSDKYARDAIVIAVAGNFDEQKLIDMFNSSLMCLRESNPTVKPDLNPYRQQIEVKKKDIEQTHICLAVPGVSLDDDRRHAFNVMNSIFGGSMSSRLFQTIREEKGLAYSVASMCNSMSYWGFFNIYAGIAHEKAEETIKAIREELDKLRTDGVSDDELLMAKEQMKSGYIFGLENVNSRMFGLGKNVTLLNRVLTPEEVMANIDSVTRKDVLDAAEMIGDLSCYSGAAVTGTDFNLEELIKR